MRISDWSSDVCSSDLTAESSAMPLDFLTFILFAPGMALLSAVLIQGRIIWWTTPWLGYAAAASVLLISAAMLIEPNRANPLQIGRASCRARVCQYVLIQVGADSLKKK